MTIWKSALKILANKKQSEADSVPVTELSIKLMEAQDIEGILSTFAKWGKTPNLFEKYLDEQQRGERIVLIACLGTKVAGYTTLIWRSPHEAFQQENIPEIMDLNVMTNMQGRG